jgi:hypothetical protein
VARFSILLLATAVAGSLMTGAVLGMSAPASAATAYPLDPSRELPVPAGAYGIDCTDRPMGNVCENVFIRALNRGRALVNAPAYVLPERFHSLTGPEQLLVLVNLDRKLYGRTQAIGLNSTLNSSAQRGAVSDADPSFVPVGGQSVSYGGSNWAGNVKSPLFAYLIWMYQDAIESWQHRHNVLMRIGDTVLIVGVGSGVDGSGMPAWTALLESFLPSTLIECVPTVLLLSARSGTDAGVPTIRIFGLGFVHVRRVTFGGVRATFERVSGILLRAVPPPNALGTVHVRVVTAGGTSHPTAAALYTY